MEMIGIVAFGQMTAPSGHDVFQGGLEDIALMTALQDRNVYRCPHAVILIANIQVGWGNGPRVRASFAPSRIPRVRFFTRGIEDSWGNLIVVSRSPVAP